MKLLLSIGLIAAISLIGSRVTFLNRNLPMGLRTILLTGVEYILIGVALGESGLGLFDTDTMDSLKPFMIFGLGWVGLLFGLQFEVKFLKRLPKYYFSITAIQAICAFIIVATAIYGVANVILSYPHRRSVILALTLASAASCTAQSAIAIVSRNYRVENKGLMGLLRYISSVDGLFAVTFFFIALSITAGLTKDTDLFLTIGFWLLSTLALGGVPAMLMIALSRVRFNPSEYLVFLIGTVTLAGGIAIQTHRSPLVIGLIMGTILANFCRHRIRAIDIVGHAERSIYIILLLLMGVYWRLEFGPALTLAVAYFLFRILGKVTGAFTALKLYKPKYNVPSAIGLGLLSEGGLAVAIVLDFRMLFPPLADTLMTVIILSIIINELIGPRLIMTQLGPERKPEGVVRSQKTST